MAASAPISPSIIQFSVPAAYRGRMSAVYLFVISVVGVAGGPMAIALVTDKIFHNPQHLNLSIALVAAIGCPLAFGFALLVYREFARLITYQR
jgi:hypothetical protein